MLVVWLRRSLNGTRGISNGRDDTVKKVTLDRYVDRILSLMDA